MTDVVPIGDREAVATCHAAAVAYASAEASRTGRRWVVRWVGPWWVAHERAWVS